MLFRSGDALDLPGDFLLTGQLVPAPLRPVGPDCFFPVDHVTGLEVFYEPLPFQHTDGQPSFMSKDATRYMTAP